MRELWEKSKWLLTHVMGFVVGIIVMIDPKHIDGIIEKHPQWSGAILALWTTLVSWANKPRAAKSQQGQGAVGAKGTD